MLTVEALAKALNASRITVSDAERVVVGGYAGDLLSWVMGRAQSGDAWVTIMSNVNVAAVAQLADVACVVFAEGVTPDANAINAARTHNINLLTVSGGTFETCAAIASLLRQEGEKQGGR